MQEFLAKQFYYNTVSQWGISLIIILLSVVLGKVIVWIFSNVIKKLTSKTKGKLDDLIVDTIQQPLVFAISVFGIWIGINQLDFPESITTWLAKVYHILITLNITWLIARLIDAIIREYIVPLTEKTESTLDDQVIPVVRKGLQSTIWIMGIVIALNNAGYDVTALIAGLGIGGLALAMAAKDSVSNIFGGIMIFADKPFKIGDRIKINGFDGTIDEIGLRTSRMRTLENRLVTIPNAVFIGNMIENVSAEPTRKVVLNIGLVYETKAEQMEQAIALLKEIGLNNQNVEDNILLSFNAFNDFSLGILFIYYIKKESDILTTQTEINLEILKQFNANGLEMAFPTQTLYHKKES